MLLIISVTPTIIVFILFLYVYKTTETKNKIDNLSMNTSIVANMIDQYDYFTSLDRDKVNEKIEQLTSIYTGRVIIVDDELKIIKDSYYDYDTDKFLVSKSIVKTLITKEKLITKNNGNIQIISPIINEEEQSIGVLVVSINNEFFDKNTRDIVYNMIIILCLLILCVMLIGSIFMKRFTKMTTILKESLSDIVDGNSYSEINMNDCTEFEEISDSINKLLIQLNELENSRQEFVSNVSHELKTPMTSIKVVADSLLNDENATLEVYKDFFEDIVVEIERENKIINDLLELVRVNKSNTYSINLEYVNINKLLEYIIKQIKPIASVRNISILFESFRDVEAYIDELKLSLAISNIVENAVKYNKEDGYIKITLNADSKFFYVKVSDSGIGISKEDQIKVFDKFYRVDKARSRETGGTGLGLSISKSIILMHSGTITVYSKVGEGTTFNIKIPLSNNKL